MSYWCQTYEEYENELYREKKMQERLDYEDEQADIDYYEARYCKDED